MKIVPALNGKAATEISYYMDIVAYIHVDKTTGKHQIIVQPHRKYLTKDRSNRLGNNPSMDFTDWINAIRGIEIKPQKVVATLKAPDEPKSDLPQPEKKQVTKVLAKSGDPIITEETGKLLFAAWNQLR